MRNELNWLHISDIHFCPATEWRDCITRSGLISYLKTLFNRNDTLKPDFIFCTGDIAYGEASFSPLIDQYDQAKLFFDNLLKVCGRGETSLQKERLFIVPGNHDVNRNSINSDAQNTLVNWAKNANDHAETINQRFNDRTKEFKDSVKRLDEYAQFIKEYVPHQIDNEGRLRFANIVEIDGLKVGIAGFNSAWTCAGPEDDRALWLAAKWQFNAVKENFNNADVRIGIIHHPVDWLNASDRDIATRRISTDFHFWLHGHSHNAWVVPTEMNVTIAAGAVGAKDSEEFGINIVHIDLSEGRGQVYLHHHKSGGTSWTIAPVETHAPEGCWAIKLPDNICKSPSPSQNITTEKIIEIDGASVPAKSASLIEKDFTNRNLTERLNEALVSFSSQPKVWVEPILRRSPENLPDAKDESKVVISDLISSPKSTIFKAPPQFGLTCLARHLAREAWRTHESFWLYLDSKSLKPHIEPIKKSVEIQLKLHRRQFSDIKCIVLDSWTNNEKNSFKILQKLCVFFKDVPVMVMQTIDEASFLCNSEEIEADREFSVLYLWSLSRGQVRKVVAGYNDKKQIGDEDAITTKVVSDLEMLNIHRTPLNCLTLLKVSEVDFDESPVNRTEMIKRVLFLLFNADDVPTYKIKPDLKDCEYVLGYFSETMLRNNFYFFSREHFLSILKDFCKQRFIDLEVEVVFDVLYANNIIIERENLFCFRFSYWIHYFAAQRMHHDENFAEFIFDDMRYAKYPEIIEFYTGTDRRREDALRILIRDLRINSDKVKEKSGLPDGLNPWKLAQWKPSSATLEQMQNEISNGVAGSNLPNSVKDQYADRNYNSARPYCQDIRDILAEYSFVYMMQIMRAGSKALRNSDFVDPEIKRQLLQEILRCWEQATKVLLVLLPFLATRGRAQFEGASFSLNEDFGSTPEERFNNILSVIPTNVVSWSQDDLFSFKMGPLLIDQLSRENNEIKKHELILLLINLRPRDWNIQIQKYIASISKNSFYLLDIYLCLRLQYMYSFASPDSLRKIAYLIKMAGAKHTTGVKEPGVKLIRKISDEEIPQRQVDITN